MLLVMGAGSAFHICGAMKKYCVYAGVRAECAYLCV